MPDQPFRIAVVGNGLAAAMAAAMLSRKLPRQRYTVVLVETGKAEAQPFGDVDASLPSVREFHARLGLDERMLVKSGSASYGLGTRYEGWSSHGRAGFLPFGDVGAPLGGVAFHQIAHRLRAMGQPVELGEYSVAELLARSGRFAHPSDDPRSPLSTYSYGLHVHRPSYAQLLREVAAHAGAKRASSPFAAVELDAGGGIAALKTASGERVDVDLVVDASGAGGSIISALPDSRFRSWREWLPCDRSFTRAHDSRGVPASHAPVTAHASGWRRAVQAAPHAAELFAYASGWSDGVAAQRIFVEGAETRFEQGRQATPWIRNCVAIGEAAAVLEPTASAPLHLLMTQVERLLKLIPADRPGAVEAREYNRLTEQEVDRARDFAILRYKLNGRTSEPFWSHVREMAVPDELAHKIGEFARRGRVPLLDGDIFEESEWALLFDELEIRPRRYDVVADTISVEQLASQVQRMGQVMQRAVASVPPYGDYLIALLRSAAA